MLTWVAACSTYTGALVGFVMLLTTDNSPTLTRNVVIVAGKEHRRELIVKMSLAKSPRCTVIPEGRVSANSTTDNLPRQDL
jgi:hypothetical protein